MRHASAIPELAELLCRYTGADEKRGNVVMIRVSDDAVAHLDRLVEAAFSGVVRKRLHSSSAPESMRTKKFCRTRRGIVPR
ncbi:MAG TPA: hypothetical protein VHS56_13700 [Candidatus Cybelea sp.]|nr:hypothetical protein [Candidatus Cybelea sp.]